jgi:CheY-like chemotaxis protein
VVDDDPELLSVLSSLLTAEQYNVRTARNGLEALDQIRGQVPDIILMDLVMPEMDGAAALNEIRKIWGRIPVIVYTGHADSILMKQALAFSPFTLLAKPCSPDELLETIHKVQRAGDTTAWKRNHYGLPKPDRN